MLVAIQHIIPYKNAGNIVRALEEFAKVCRDKMSETVIDTFDGTECRYTLIVTERWEDRKGNLSHKRYVGFATNFDADVTEYSRGWGTETGSRMIQSIRIKMCNKNFTVRLLFFAYSAGV